MSEIEKQAEAIVAEKKRKLTAAMGKNLMFEYRVSKMVAAFRIRYEKRKAQRKDLENQVMKDHILSGPGDMKDTVESHMSLRGVLEFKLREYENEIVLKRVISKGASNSLDKFYFCFYDDILAWKEKISSHKVEGKVFLTSIQDIGPEQDKFFYFVQSS